MRRMSTKSVDQFEDNRETVQSVEDHFRGEAQDVRVRMLRFLVDGSMVVIGC